MVEQLIRNQQVGGSSPLCSTIFFNDLGKLVLQFCESFAEISDGGPDSFLALGAYPNGRPKVVSAHKAIR